jgi:hypothetical protein
MRRDSATSSKVLKQFSSLAVFIGITTFAAFALLGVQRLVAQTPAAQTHFTFPETPPAKELQAWLAAFDSGDRAVYSGRGSQHCYEIKWVPVRTLPVTRRNIKGRPLWSKVWVLASNPPERNTLL